MVDQCFLWAEGENRTITKLTYPTKILKDATSQLSRTTKKYEMLSVSGLSQPTNEAVKTGGTLKRSVVYSTQSTHCVTY